MSLERVTAAKREGRAGLELYRFIKSGDQGAMKGVLGMALTSGVATTVLLALVNSATAQSAHLRGGGSVSLHGPMLFLVAFAIHYVANRTALLGASTLVERALAQLRTRIVDKVRRAELSTIDKLGKGELYSKVSRGSSRLAQLFPALVSAAQQGLLLFFCALYMVLLSPVAAILIGLLTAGLGAFFIRKRKHHRVLVALDAVKQAELLDALDHFVEGFKETRMSMAKSDALQQEFEKVAGEAEVTVVRIADTWSLALIFTSVYLYLLLAVLVYLLPHFRDGVDPMVIKLTAAALFCFGPLTAVVTLLPLFEQAEAGLRELSELEARLDAGARDLPTAEMAETEMLQKDPFKELACQGLTFSYRDHRGDSVFTSGPWSLQIERGELLFFVGGNGSGKSTLLKLLTGLYPPDAGSLLLNGHPVDPLNPSELREHICCIFADFHLFDRLYGLENVDPAKVNALIARMRLDDKVTFQDGRFSNLQLSTGQRKRLAMIVALLEDRDIYVFDEWAADQDWEFRDTFYTQLLPELKGLGKTCLVVSHDDRYWNVADRVIKLESGLPAKQVEGPS